MKIAIHNQKGGFTERWVAYCQAQRIPYKLVNCYHSDIVGQLEDCDALMWHHNHGRYVDILSAKPLLFALQQSGKKVFPDFNTGWHFDDKVGQKYLFEAIGAPMVPGYVFYDKKSALEWLRERESFPLVFKLRGGAGSANVKLVRSRGKAKSMVCRAFGRGFRHADFAGLAVDSFKKMIRGAATLRDVAKYIALMILPSRFGVGFPREKGYVYFQDFMPGNDSDIRVIVIGNRAFAIKRIVRENDFRASGSGNIVYAKEAIPIECVRIAFELNKKLNSQSIAYDFIFDQAGSPLIVEISYGFSVAVYDPCPGYWTDDLQWHEGPFDPYGWMIDNMIDR